MKSFLLAMLEEAIKNLTNVARCSIIYMLIALVHVE